MAHQITHLELSESTREFILDLVDRLEANQRNAESGTTGCLAAGGGIEQGKPGVWPVGNPADFSKLKDAARTYRRKLNNRYQGVGDHRTPQILTDVNFVIDQLLEIMEQGGAA